MNVGATWNGNFFWGGVGGRNFHFHFLNLDAAASSSAPGHFGHIRQK